jgi:hypothetical protein
VLCLWFFRFGDRREFFWKTFSVKNNKKILSK